MSVVDPTIDEAYELLTNTLNDMADAIRIKTGIAGDIDAQDYADDILSITSGGDLDLSNYELVNSLIKEYSGGTGIAKELFDTYIYPITSDKVTYPSVIFYVINYNSTKYVLFIYGQNGGSFNFPGVFINHYYTSRSYLYYYGYDGAVMTVLDFKKTTESDISVLERTSLFSATTIPEYRANRIQILAKFDYTHHF